MDAIEVVVGDSVLRLDGTVVEVLHKSGQSDRFHVNHVAVHAKPKGRSMIVHVGVEASGIVIGGAKLNVPETQVPVVTGLFEQAKARRTG